MEQLNQVTLRGIIGNASVQKIGDIEMVRFSLATTYAGKNRSGEQFIETIWHNVVAYKNSTMPDFSTLVKGAWVLVKGRIRNHFIDENGNSRIFSEVFANDVELVK